MSSTMPTAAGTAQAPCLSEKAAATTCCLPTTTSKASITTTSARRGLSNCRNKSTLSGVGNILNLCAVESENPFPGDRYETEHQSTLGSLCRHVHVVRANLRC